MRTLLQPFSSPKLLLCIGLTAGAVWPDAPYPVMLERYNQDIQENPQNYLKRTERASLVLENRDTVKTTEDIDTLLSRPEWHNEGLHLKAVRLHLQGRQDEAETLIQQNIRGNIHVSEESRLLAEIELFRKDTAAAITAYRTAWDHDSDETDYIDLLDLQRGRGNTPEELLQQGLRLYPKSPGAIQSVFEVYSMAGDSVSLNKALQVADRAANSLWPLSVDWKIRHAQALLSLKRLHEAEPVLLAALDLLDEDPRLKGQDSEPVRKQIFILLEAARK